MSVTHIKALERRLSHSFADPKRLQVALTHRSIRLNNNERLEFLGDALLGFVITDYLYHAFTQASEGVLSHLRSVLVSRKTLAALARELKVGESLQLGVSELKSGAFNRDSILADAMEAIMGAIYLDAGEDTCRRCILKWYRNRLEDPDLLHTQKDAKSQLQEYCQSQKWPLPVYTLVATDGLAHALNFTVNCTVEGFEYVAMEVAETRRQAEQAAAERLLQALYDAKH